MSVLPYLISTNLVPGRQKVGDYCLFFLLPQDETLATAKQQISPPPKHLLEYMKNNLSAQ